MSDHLSPELHEKIRIKAYLLWEKAGCPGGDGSQFWVEAEKVMVRMAKLSEAKKAKAVAKPAAKVPAKAKAKVKIKTKVKAPDPSLVSEEKPEKKKKKKDKKKKSEKKKDKK